VFRSWHTTLLRWWLPWRQKENRHTSAGSSWSDGLPVNDQTINCSTQWNVIKLVRCLNLSAALRVLLVFPFSHKSISRGSCAWLPLQHENCGKRRDRIKKTIDLLKSQKTS
jgi:hypothetical protein